MNKIVVTALLLAVMLTFSSCNLFRRVFHRKPRHTAGNVIPADNAVAKTDTAKTPFSGTDTAKSTGMLSSLLPLWNRSIAYNTFSGKAKVHYEGKGDQQDFTAIIRMERGRKIWVSVIALGLVEALRAQVTPDSVIAVDRIHHTVKALPASEAGKVLPAGFNFSTFQQLLIGDVLAGAGSPDAVNTLSGGQWQFTLTSGDTYQNAVFTPRDSTLESQTVQAGQNAAFASIRYENYGLEGGRRFSKHRIMQLRDKGEVYNVELEFSRAEFDVPVDMPFSIPARYDKK